MFYFFKTKCHKSIKLKKRSDITHIIMGLGCSFKNIPFNEGGHFVKWHIVENSKKITSSKLVITLPMAYHFVKIYS